jgi:hypothetical protein
MAGTQLRIVSPSIAVSLTVGAPACAKAAAENRSEAAITAARRDMVRVSGCEAPIYCASGKA